MEGKVMRLFRDQGFGFIRNGCALDYFFHRDETSDWRVLYEGAAVTFEPAPKDRWRGGPRAEQVRLVIL